MTANYYDDEENVRSYIEMAAGYDGADLIEKLGNYLPAASTVLEIGMGPGTDLDLLNQHFRTVGSDRSMHFLNLYRADHPDADLLVLDATTLETDRTFAGIYSNKVLHHLTQTQLGHSLARQADLLELDGMTMGIVGLGRIGRATARLAHAFGMNILASDPLAIDRDEYVEMVDLDTLFRQSDVVTLHCPLTAQTKQLVNQHRLGLMKNTAFLINTSRGPLVDEQALAAALNAGRIAGAGLDVLAAEPPPDDNPLLRAENCQITPHIAWATYSSRCRLLDTAVDNVAAFLEGNPQNVVN